MQYADYRAWVTTQPCAACGTRKNVQAAHVGIGGMSLKHGSDAEVIPLCGPHIFSRWIDKAKGHALARTVPGCHAEHDQCAGQFLLMTREQRRAWDAHQVAVHRGRFEARGVGTFEEVPF